MLHTLVVSSTLVIISTIIIIVDFDKSLSKQS